MPARISSEVLSLRHDFTPDERLSMGGELAAAYATEQAIEEEKKSAMAGFKERETQLKLSIGSLSRKYQTGFEMQNVKCRLVYDHPNVGEVSYFDPVGALVKTRPMTDAERQLELDLGEQEQQKTDAEAQQSTEQSNENIKKFFPGKKAKSDNPPPDDPEGQCKNCELWFPASVLKTTDQDFLDLCPACWESCVEEPKRKAAEQADQQASPDAPPASPEAPGEPGEDEKGDDKPADDLGF